MGAASYILAINLLVAGLFAGAFGWLALHARVRLPARWFAGAYLLGMAYYGIEALIPAFEYPRFVVFAAFSAFLLALAAFVVGIARRYDVAVPWTLTAAIILISLPLNLAIFDMPRASFLRVLLYQLPYSAMQALAAMVILRAPLRRPIDWLLFGVLAASAVHFVLKAFLATVFVPGPDAQDYVRSTYALISQSSGAILIVGTGLLLLAMLVGDVFADATEKSETDPLTGLLNRRGFEARTRFLAGLASRTRVPASIVICDLDHFKSVNDTYGHASGDRVIAAFADRLREALAEGYVAGRIGGEEFAVLLPGADASVARLFAEGVRSAFAARSVEGLPDGMRFTASFGVAELRPADTMSEMLRRADSALYEAKSSGRDRVRVASFDGIQRIGPRRSVRGL